jgi:hypothetical protein
MDVRLHFKRKTEFKDGKNGLGKMSHKWKAGTTWEVRKRSFGKTEIWGLAAEQLT